MFFTECARIAEQHPDLANVLRQLDSQFRSMRTAELIRPGDLASFLNIDPNQVRSALDMLTQEGVLLREEMVECANCEMAVLWSEYQEALNEDDEYRCTSCDRPLTGRTIHLITTYRGREKWQDVVIPGGSGNAGPGAASSSSPTSAVVDEQAWYTYDRLAEVFSVGKDPLRKRLDRYRGDHLDGWIESDDRRPREPKYLYRLRDVKGVIEELRASSQRPAR